MIKPVYPQETGENGVAIEHEDNQRKRIGEIIRGEKPGYKSSAVLIPLVHEDDGWKIIVTQRSDRIPFAGDISFPGGKLEKGETIEQAALREAFEEINLDPRKVLISGALGTNVAHFNKRLNNPKTYTMQVVEGGHIRDHTFVLNEPRVYAIHPVIGLVHDNAALDELKANKSETLRILKIPVAPLLEAVKNLDAGKTEGNILKKVEKDDILQYRFDIPDPERAGQTVEIRHITAGILRDFLEPFKNEMDLSEFLLTAPQHKLDKEPSWKTRIVTGSHDNHNNNGKQH